MNFYLFLLYIYGIRNNENIGIMAKKKQQVEEIQQVEENTIKTRNRRTTTRN